MVIRKGLCFMNDLLSKYSEQAFNGKSDSTRKTYVNEINIFNEWLDGAGTDISNFSRVDVQHYINNLASKQLAASTINKKFRAITHFCKFFGLEENIKDIRVIAPENIFNIAPKALTRNERNHMMREVARNGSKRDFAVISTLLNTGIRVSECSKIKLANLIDISDKKGFMKVEGKGFKERIVPLNSDTRYALNAYLQERSIDIYNLDKLSKAELQQPLFLSNFNKNLSVESIQRIVKIYGNTHPHTLRHTFATVLIREKDADIAVVAQLLGHANMNTVQRYTKASKEDLVKIVDDLTFD